jgi:hypothetical protein
MFEINPDAWGCPRQYIDLITSPTPVAYDDLSDVDRQGIEAGKALVGMSKEGVKIALGYPARHRTPSLEDNRWTYWRGRHDTYVVEFDADGKVVSHNDGTDAGSVWGGPVLAGGQVVQGHASSKHGCVPQRPVLRSCGNHGPPITRLRPASSSASTWPFSRWTCNPKGRSSSAARVRSAMRSSRRCGPL